MKRAGDVAADALAEAFDRFGIEVEPRSPASHAPSPHVIRGNYSNATPRAKQPRREFLKPDDLELRICVRCHNSGDEGKGSFKACRNKCATVGDDRP